MNKINITNICDIQVGKTPSRSNPAYWGDGSLWLSIADMNQGTVLEKTKETITDKAIKECRCKIIPENTVLFSFKLSIGKVGITKLSMYSNEAIAAFIIKDHSKLDTKFLFYVLKSVDYSIGSNKAVMGKTLNKEQLKKIKIPLPPIEDQKKIVKILDQADSLRQKRKQAIVLLDEFVKSVFVEMFGDPINNPKKWEIIKFDNVISDIKYGSSRKSLTESIENSVPILRIPNILNGFVNYNALQYQILPSNEKNKLILKKGDILFVRTNGNPDYIGRCAVFEDDKEYIYASYLIRTRLKQNPSFIPLFIRYILSMDSYKHKIRKESRTTAGNYNINTKGIKNFDLIKPPLKLQEKFITIFKNTELLRQKMLEQYGQLENQFQALMQKCFSLN